MIFGYKTNGASNYQSFFNPSAPNSNNGWWFPADLTISLPNHSITTFEVVTMLGGGHSGTNNRIVLH